MGSFMIKGILIGILFGIPVGAVGAMTAQKTLNYGMKAGLLTGLGSSVADCLYACVGAFGLTIISDFLLQHQNIINLVGGCLILGMGIQMLRTKNLKLQKISDSTGPIMMFVSSFVVGITNPAAILTFLFAFSWFGINEQIGLEEGIGLVCGVFIGTYIWWGTLSGVVMIWKKKAKGNHFSIMNRVFGVILILFGTVVLVSLSGMILSAGGNKEGNSIENSDENPEDILDGTRENTLEEGMGVSPEETTGSNKEIEGVQMQEMIIEVGGQKFQAALYDSETVQVLRERLPMTLNMEELHGNEKFNYLEEGLPLNSENVGSIQTGDIMLFGSDCLVLFFDDFSTSYSYTRIGHIEDAEGFANVLASGTVEITFETGE